ncbi:hypothetical protein ON010_g12927 [Phytophthora cinnamomi]|nr:hypothetical protein ON010_g12927 [Phytophthora cinnamomi]
MLVGVKTVALFAEAMRAYYMKRATTLLGAAAYWHGLVAAEAAPFTEGQVRAVARAGVAGCGSCTASLPYDATWVAVAVGELAALAFFTTTGYRFRPLPVNPYLEVPMHEDDLEEFALDDDEDDLDFRNIQRTDIRKFAYGAPVKTKASYSIKSTAGNSSPERASYAKKRSGSFNSDL